VETLDEILARAASNRVPRRSFLAAAGLLGGSAALAACGGGGATAAPSTGGEATPAPSTGGEATPAPSEGGGTSFPPAGDVEKELYVYNWSDYISPDNIDAFKQQFGVEKFQYDIFANNEELLAKLQAGATGYDIAVPTAEYVPAMVEGGYLQKLDWSRIPNAQYIDPAFKGLAWDPNDEWQLPKDFGTTGVMYRGKLVKEPLTSWQEFLDLAKGKYSGKVVVVDSMGDVFVMPLKMMGKSLNSTDKADLDEARKILLDLAPHVLALDSDTYNLKLASEEAAMALCWTGGLVEMRDNPETADVVYTVPSEGTLFWLDTWVMLNEAPNPNAAYAFLNFIHDPEVQAEETNYNGYGSPNDEAKKYIDPEILADEAFFPSEAAMENLEGAVDTSSNQQRIDIWQEFKSKIGG
jgi:spermidine/putrescine transport system substrate-binding protein